MGVWLVGLPRPPPQCCRSNGLRVIVSGSVQGTYGLPPASSSGSDDDSSVTSESMESDDAPGVVPVTKDEVIDSSEDDKPLRGIWDCTMHFLRDDHQANGPNGCLIVLGLHCCGG